MSLIEIPWDGGAPSIMQGLPHHPLWIAMMLWLFRKCPVRVSSCMCYFLATLPNITSMSVCLSSPLTNGSGISRWLFLLFWKMAEEGASRRGQMVERQRGWDCFKFCNTHTTTMPIDYAVTYCDCNFKLQLSLDWLSLTKHNWKWCPCFGPEQFSRLYTVTVFLAFSESFNPRLSAEATIADHWLSDVQKKWGWADFYCPSSSQRRG